MICRLFLDFSSIRNFVIHEKWPSFFLYNPSAFCFFLLHCLEWDHRDGRRCSCLFLIQHSGVYLCHRPVRSWLLSPHAGPRNQCNVWRLHSDTNGIRQPHEFKETSFNSYYANRFYSFPERILNFSKNFFFIS